MSDAILAQLQQRLRYLEDIQSITTLKARYLRACDQKQPNAMRECFVKYGAVIEADGFPPFRIAKNGLQPSPGWRLPTLSFRICITVTTLRSALQVLIVPKACGIWILPDQCQGTHHRQSLRPIQR